MNLYEIPVHPAARLAHLLEGDELAALAESVRVNGLRKPVVVHVDSNGGRSILDGRNRLRACEIAGVEPSFIEFDGDPWEYALDADERRYQSKGQRAMSIVARAARFDGGVYSVNDREAQGGSVYSVNGRTAEMAARAGTTKGYVSQARKVLERAPEKVLDVIDGRTTLSAVHRGLVATPPEPKPEEPESDLDPWEQAALLPSAPEQKPGPKVRPEPTALSDEDRQEIQREAITAAVRTLLDAGAINVDALNAAAEAEGDTPEASDWLLEIAAADLIGDEPAEGFGAPAQEIRRPRWGMDAVPSSEEYEVVDSGRYGVVRRKIGSPR